MSKFETVIPATGSYGNVFMVLGSATRMMKQLGVDQGEIERLRSNVMFAGSYKEAINFIRCYFPVATGDNEEAA